MSRLIHLNGPPGIGKSTLARAYVAGHRGTLLCDVDVLRTMIGGWAEDFASAGALVRPAALGLIGGYLAHSGDVVLPQMLVDPAEVERFAAVAADADAAYVEVMLLAEHDDAVARFHRRGGEAPGDPWHEQVREVVAAEGGDAQLRRLHTRLLDLLALRPWVRVVRSREHHPEETLAAVVDAVATWPR